MKTEIVDVGGGLQGGGYAAGRISEPVRPVRWVIWFLCKKPWTERWTGYTKKGIGMRGSCGILSPPASYISIYKIGIFFISLEEIVEAL